MIRPMSVPDEKKPPQQLIHVPRGAEPGRVLRIDGGTIGGSELWVVCDSEIEEGKSQWGERNYTGAAFASETATVLKLTLRPVSGTIISTRSESVSDRG